ncbi:MAG: PIN domain-containing protein [Leptolyngbyaceae bacterium]|nr:PIN domain-containing protein [Leptolyngbyaceae bacterium]
MRISAIADTGFVVALISQQDAKHQQVSPIYYQQQAILLPQTISILAETAYLLAKDMGNLAVAVFPESLPESRFQLVALEGTDIIRISQILRNYADSRIDFVDASVMAIAERFNLTAILTLDQRDFRLFRPKHCQNFTLWP